MEAESIINPITHEFSVPKKIIDSEVALEQFKKTKTYENYMKFITALQMSVCQKSHSKTILTQNLTPLYNIIEVLDKWVDEIPPIQQPMRFGNKAFRTWLDRVKDEFAHLMQDILPNENLRKALPELREYFMDSFGSYERIDYGTGHEMNFVAFIYCLYKLGLIVPDDFEAAVNKVFNRYLLLMRKLQTVYMLEPAGSHGVWGIDDYQFLAFLFGASQLVDHEVVKPDSIQNDKIITDYSKDYMYLGCIAFIKSVKKGIPFWESSPILHDISAVPTWQKVSAGMIKMYMAEVLHKLPVIKHFRFGSIIKFE